MTQVYPSARHKYTKRFRIALQTIPERNREKCFHYCNFEFITVINECTYSWSPYILRICKLYLHVIVRRMPYRASDHSHFKTFKDYQGLF